MSRYFDMASNSVPAMPASELGYVPWTKTLCSMGKNYVEGVSNCDAAAKVTCGNCKLVKYCSEKCRENDFHHQAMDCWSGLRDPNWLPAFAKEQREPSGLVPFASESHIKHLWGTLPAFDILNLSRNEGSNYQGDLAMYFPYAIDLRNVIATVCAIPDTYKGRVSITINSPNAFNLARNFTMLYLAATQEPKVAAEMMVHLWFSMRFTSKIVDIINQGIVPALATLSLNWPAGPAALNCATFYPQLRLIKTCLLVLKCTCSQLTSILRILTTTIKPAPRWFERHRAVTNPLERDYRDIQYACQRPAWRTSTARYRRRGVLAPLRARLNTFDCLNPTFYNPDTGKTVLSEAAVALEGWYQKKVIHYGSGFSEDDLHGQLYSFLRNDLEIFAHRLQSGMSFSFEICAGGINHAAAKGQKGLFDRIDTAQLAEHENIRLQPLLEKFGPLLKKPKENPHATMFTVFEGAWHQKTVDYLQHVEIAEQAMDHLTRLDAFGIDVSINDPKKQKAISVIAKLAGQIFESYDDIFARYMDMEDFARVAEKTEMKIKVGNKVIKKWPKRLFKKAGEQGAQEEFDLLLASKIKGQIRVVEWTRKD